MTRVLKGVPALGRHPLYLVVAGLVLLAAGSVPGIAGQRPRPAPATCGDVRDELGCREVVVDGRRVRYTLLRDGAPVPPGTGGELATLMDQGGPGIALFGVHHPGETLFLDSVPERLRGRILLFVEEPWVLAGYPDRCRGAMTAHYRAARDSGGTAGPAATVADRCGLFDEGRWGWSPATYRASVQAVADAEGLRLEGVLATSFGARRFLDLDIPGLSWAAAVDPAPVALDGRSYLAERTEGVYRYAAELCAACGGQEGIARILEDAETALAEDVSVPTRSLPVTAADVGPAFAALAYGDPEQFERGFAAFRAPREQAELIGRLSDAVWSRYDVDSIAPPALAYLAEVCRAYGPWPADDMADTGDPVAEFLADAHRPCRSAPPPTPVTTRPQVRLCLASGPLDPVAPAAFTATWVSAFPDAQAIDHGVAGHARGDGIGRCMAALGL